MNITILGGGAWGTALAIALAEKHAIRLWCREDDVVESITNRRENSRFLPRFLLPSGIEATADFQKSLENAALLLLAVPVAGLRPTLTALQGLEKIPPFLWLCKGFEAKTALLPHQVVHAVLGDSAAYGVLSGPSFAEEVAAGQPTALSLGSTSPDFSRAMAKALHLPRLRIYANDDLVGVEVGGAVKNVLAIATGISDGLSLGLNTRAALITRGLAEIARLGLSLGAKRETFMGLSGVGDLLLTCTGDLSRNRRVGLSLAAGKKLPQILEELGHVAEGVSTAREVAALARRQGVDMPICQAVADLLDGYCDAEQVLDRLLSRSAKDECF